MPGQDAESRKRGRIEKRAQKVLTRLLAEVDAQRAPTSTVALSYVLGEWLRTAELEDTTRRTYVGYIDRTIVPAIGDVAADRLTARCRCRRG